MKPRASPMRRDWRTAFEVTRPQREIRVVTDTGLVAVVIPSDTLGGWALGNEIALQSEIALADGTTVQVLIEKEFACKHGATETNERFFPDPTD